MKVGRYALGERIAAGGMAAVHLGRLEGSAGFSRTVAIKRLHPHLCEDPAFTGAFADEARLAARIRHPNVVPTLDVVRADGELLIVMEYVDGDSLSALVRKTGKELIPLPIVVAIVSEMLHGLHSAHEAKSEAGRPLDIVHRDVSPQNVLVGADGVARLVDFGIARATSKNSAATTGENDLKGKLAYMAPEQIRRENITRRADIYAAGIVLWELLTGERLFASDNEAATMEKILVGWVQPPGTVRLDLPAPLDDITLRALDPDPENRFETARDMAVALEDAVHRALGRDVAAWVENTARDTLATRRTLVARAEKAASSEATHTNLTLESAVPEPPTTPRRDRFAPASPAEVREVGMEYERTVTSFEEPPAPPPPPRRSHTDRVAYALFGLAVVLTLVIGLSWSTIAPPASPPSPAVLVPELPPPAPPPVETAPLPANPPPKTAPSAARPVLRPRPKPTAPAKPPCTSKLDPATGRTLYTGDCN